MKLHNFLTSKGLCPLEVRKSPQGVSHMDVQYILATEPSTRNYISCSKNELKLTYSNVEFQKISGEGPRFKRRGGKRRGKWREMKKWEKAGSGAMSFGGERPCISVSHKFDNVIAFLKHIIN
jgi:hypothetical protein